MGSVEKGILGARPGRVKGFALVELMVALAVILIMSTLFMGQIDSDHKRLRSAAYNLRCDLVRAKSEAVKRNEPVVVNFNPVGFRGYQGVIDPGLPSEIRLFQVNLASSQITLDNTHYAGQRVTFNPRRGALNGYVVLSNSDGEQYEVRTNNAGKIWIETP